MSDNSIVANTYIPLFILLVSIEGLEKPVTLYVQSFTLKKIVNSMVQCDVVAASGISLFLKTLWDDATDGIDRIKNKEYANGVRIFKASLLSTSLMSCKLKTKTIKAEDSMCYFKGYVLMATPSLSTNQINTKSELSIACIGLLYQLMLSPGKDYNWIPAGLKITLDSITKALYGDYQKSTTGDKFSNTLTNMITRAGISKDTNIADILAKFDRTFRATKSLDDKGKPVLKAMRPNLSDFILSDYGISKHIQNLSIGAADNPYIEDICRSYSKGVTQNTLWNGLLESLCTDKLLQLIPPSIQSTAKLHTKFSIKPIAHKYIQDKDQLFTITALNITGVYLSADLRRQIAIPDYLAITFDISKYTGSPINVAVAYGVYPPVTDKEQTLDKKVRVLLAPAWMGYSACSGLDLKKYNLSTSTADSKGSAESKYSSPASVSNYLILRQAYARLLFYKLYSSNKNMQIAMPFTKDTMNIDTQLGLPIRVTFNATNLGDSKNSWQTLNNLLGVVNMVSYNYRAADGVTNSTSSFTINVELTMIALLGSLYAKAFTLLSTDIYIKKG